MKLAITMFAALTIAACAAAGQDPVDIIVEQAPLAQKQRDTLLARIVDLSAKVIEMEQEIARLQQALDECLGGGTNIPRVLWVQPDFNPALSQPDLPIKTMRVAYQHLLDRDYKTKYGCDGVRDPDKPNRVIAVIFKDKDVTLLEGHSYELCLKTPTLFRSIVSPSGFYPKGTPLLLNRHIWDPNHKIKNKHAFIYDFRLDEAKFTAWLEQLPDPSYIGLNHEQCSPMWDLEHPNHQQCIEMYVQEVAVARQAWPEALVTHYVPPRGKSSGKWPDAFTPKMREQYVNAYQPVYQAGDFLGNDLYAHCWYEDNEGDMERVAKEWMAWNLDTWLMAAKGKDVGVWMMARVEFNASQHANALIPKEDLIDRFRFILEHEYNGDRVDYIVVWHPMRSDADDLYIMNAIRVAAGLPELPSP